MPTYLWGLSHTATLERQRGCLRTRTRPGMKKNGQRVTLFFGPKQQKRLETAASVAVACCILQQKEMANAWTPVKRKLYAPIAVEALGRGRQ